MSNGIRRRLLLTTVIFSHTMMWCGMCQGEFSEEVNNSTIMETIHPKHISWIALGSSSSNYSTICNHTSVTSVFLNRCFSDWEKNTVLFYLFNRGRYEFRNGSELLKLGDEEQLRKSTFNRRAPLKFIIHGYKQNGFSQFSHLIKEAYLKYGNETNVIVVDWRWLAGETIYFNSAFNTRIAGERLGEFIVYLRKIKYIKSYRKVHLIGFSLGAHVASFAAKHVKKMTRIRIGRITGLDPAGPWFSGSKAIYRLDFTDAVFVDVIHTCVGRSGITESIGHVDFYPNGGIDQPGCEWERLHSFLLKNCSHERAFQFFLQSIKGEKFIGCSCPNWDEFQTGNCRCRENTPGAELMGENCSVQARGNKYLATTSDNRYISI